LIFFYVYFVALIEWGFVADWSKITINTIKYSVSEKLTVHKLIQFLSCRMFKKRLIILGAQVERYGLFRTVNDRIRRSYGENTDSRIDWSGYYLFKQTCFNKRIEIDWESYLHHWFLPLDIVREYQIFWKTKRYYAYERSYTFTYNFKTKNKSDTSPVCSRISTSCMTCKIKNKDDWRDQFN